MRHGARWAGSWAVAGAFLLLVGCGGSGGTGVDPNAPAISNLRVVFLPTPCSLGGGLTGRTNSRIFDYTDADGDLAGGTVETTTTFDVGAPIVESAAIPSRAVRLTGTTSGTVTVTFCVRFNAATSLQAALRVTDASGKGSNVLQTEVARPAGVPLAPQASAERPGGAGRLTLR